MTRRLCEWFEREARDLPWRRPSNRTGYSALVAEAMLQQTQVSRVVERYEAFMRHFPTVHHLAQADRQDVLAMWQGLGYYRRACNLHAAAQMIVDEFGGEVPQTVDALRQLPGVGPYTAGAIASIVFGRREPIVDGNVGRVLARLFGKRGPPNDKRMIDWTWRTARELVEHAEQPGALNEAMMELGAVVCGPAPSKPRCEHCPVAHFCQAHRCGTEGRIPQAKKRTPPRTVHHHVVIVAKKPGGKILLEQRDDRGMWAGMWQAPTIESARALSLSNVKKHLMMPVEGLSKRGRFDHHTSHRRIKFHIYTASTRSRQGTWRAMNELAGLPMSSAQRRALASAATGV